MNVNVTWSKIGFYIVCSYYICWNCLYKIDGYYQESGPWFSKICNTIVIYRSNVIPESCFKAKLCTGFFNPCNVGAAPLAMVKKNPVEPLQVGRPHTTSAKCLFLPRGLNTKWSCPAFDTQFGQSAPAPSFFLCSCGRESGRFLMCRSAWWSMYHCCSGEVAKWQKISK